MVVALRLFFTVVLATMLGVTGWASTQVPLWGIPRAVGAHPWFLATLADTYWGFFTFYLWLAYKETSTVARVLWFLAIVLLGNIAMASYGLAVTLRTPATAPIEAVLQRGRPVSPALPAALLAGFGLIAAVAALA
ncbi:MAG TPA: DUF1475 family protein [Lacunisphaera sp.]|nr:DUF1475 family protein [Lacunisphaera sp.]